MQAFKFALALVLASSSALATASIVPVTDEVVATNLQSQGGKYVEGYVELNKTQKSISLILQPVMPLCAGDHYCTAVMPRPLDYFFPQTSRVVDDCNAVTYRAEQNVDHLIRVTVIDNSQYSQELCPTFAPLPETVVMIEQSYLDNTGSVRLEESLSGAPLATVQY